MPGTKHTPGPWWIWQERAARAEGLDGDDLDMDLIDGAVTGADFSIYSGEPLQITRGHMSGPVARICDISDFCEANEDPAVALDNARLIAAGPPLLDACRKAHEALLGCCRFLLGTGPQPTPESMHEATRATRSALAKVKGRELAVKP